MLHPPNRRNSNRRPDALRYWLTHSRLRLLRRRTYRLLVPYIIVRIQLRQRIRLRMQPRVRLFCLRLPGLDRLRQWLPAQWLHLLSGPDLWLPVLGRVLLGRLL